MQPITQLIERLTKGPPLSPNRPGDPVATIELIRSPDVGPLAVDGGKDGSGDLERVTRQLVRLPWLTGQRPRPRPPARLWADPA